MSSIELELLNLELTAAIRAVDVVPSDVAARAKSAFTKSRTIRIAQQASRESTGEAVTEPRAGAEAP
jgi:hypothetical protein